MNIHSPVLWVIVIVLVLLIGVGVGYALSRRQRHEPEKPPNPQPAQRPTLSKEDAMQIMELIECLYEIDQVK